MSDPQPGALTGSVQPKLPSQHREGHRGAAALGTAQSASCCLRWAQSCAWGQLSSAPADGTATLHCRNPPHPPAACECLSTGNGWGWLHCRGCPSPALPVTWSVWNREEPLCCSHLCCLCCDPLVCRELLPASPKSFPGFSGQVIPHSPNFLCILPFGSVGAQMLCCGFAFPK